MYILYSAAVLSLLLLQGCVHPPGAENSVRIVCGFAKLLVKEADIPTIEKAFETRDGAGTRLCNSVHVLLTGDKIGEGEPITVEEPQILEVALPNGALIAVTLLPPGT